MLGVAQSWSVLQGLASKQAHIFTPRASSPVSLDNADFELIPVKRCCFWLLHVWESMVANTSASSLFSTLCHDHQGHWHFHHHDHDHPHHLDHDCWPVFWMLERIEVLSLTFIATSLSATPHPFQNGTSIWIFKISKLVFQLYYNALYCSCMLILNGVNREWMNESNCLNVQKQSLCTSEQNNDRQAAPVNIPGRGKSSYF